CRLIHSRVLLNHSRFAGLAGEYRYNPGHLEDKNMLNYKKENGFSIADLMIAIAIAGLISVASIPSLKKWSRNYNVKSAAMDLYGHMEIAKLGAVKENKSWTINFNPGGLLGYQVRNSAGNIVKTVDFRLQYNGEIQYADPTATKTYDASSIAFNPNGLSG